MVYVPPNGPAVHAEPAGEFGRRPDAAGLQEFEQGQHAGGRSGHA